MAKSHAEKEWQTRKKRVDPKLDAAGWRRPPKGTLPLHLSHWSEEEPTANGPADYAPWLDNQAVGVVEAKKLTVGPQNVVVRARAEGTRERLLRLRRGRTTTGRPSP
jgi:type I restriction enzyme R subunit